MSDIRINYVVDKGQLVLARKELDKINKELGVSKKESNAAAGALKKVGTAVIAAFAVDKLVDFGRKVVDITAEFQKLQAVLTNTLGSKSAADAAFTRIQDFASKTPFQVTQLTASFVKLANQGFVPTNNELRKLGDLASSTGKDFDQLTEAIIDAQVGEFERLKEFGIRASKEGDNVTFTFKGVQQQVDFTEQSIRDYILSLGDLQGVSGSMAAISETLGGQISNLGDSFDSLFFAIGQATGGVISGAIAALATVVNKATELIKLVNGITDDAAEEFNKLNEEFKPTNQKEYAEAIAEVKKRIDELNQSTDKTEQSLVKIAKESQSVADAEKALGENTKATISEFEEAAKVVEDNSLKIEVYTDFLKKLEKEQSQLTETNIESDIALSALSDTYEFRFIDTIREAQRALYDLGEQSKITLEEIQEFIAESGDAYQEEDYKTAERELEALARYNENERIKRQIAQQTAQERLTLEATVVSGISQLSGELTRTLGDGAKAFIIFEKALSIAEVIINLQKELSAIAAYSAANPANVLTGGAAGAAIFTTQAAIAKTRAGFRIATIGAQAVGKIIGFKDGVIDLNGPGSETSDSIHAMLSRGESVMTAKETRNFMPTLKAIRENKVDPELLNGISEGKTQVHNNIVQVPTQSFHWDENGFYSYHQKGLDRTRKRANTYKW